MLEKWKTKGDCIVEIDALSSNGRVKSGCAIENGSATRCLWDAKTGQCWGPERWDLVEGGKDSQLLMKGNPKEIKENALAHSNKQDHSSST